MSCYDLMKYRASVRLYRPEPVPRTIILRILKAATWAPSAHNAQPWRFVVVDDREIKARLAEAMGERWKRDLLRDGVEPERVKELVDGSVKRLIGIPALVVVCLTMSNMDKYPDTRRRRAEYLMAVQSVAAAIENLLLAAHAEGLGACWICAPLFAAEEVKEVLKLPQDFEPQALVTLGYPAEKPAKPPRKPLEEVVRFNFWGKP